VTRDQQIELLRVAANKLVAAGMAADALPLSELADDWQTNPYDSSPGDTDTRLYLANTVDQFIQFARMLRSV